MVRLEKITSSLFPRLYSAFLIDDDPLSGEPDWRSVFDYRWHTPEGHCGYAMLDGDQVVGMMGMVFSTRIINEAYHQFCNIHTWWVHEAYRGHSLMMLRPVRELDSRYTVTHFTPCDTIRALYGRLGFSSLSSQLRIMLPYAAQSGHQELELVREPSVLSQDLNERDYRIHHDHLPYPCSGVLFRDSEDDCYVLYNHVMRHRLPYIHVQYVGNRNMFAAKEIQIRAALLSEEPGAKFVAMDERLTGELEPKRSFRFWAPANALFKSNELSPHQIDNLYSDVVFLGLTTLPHMTFEIKKYLGNAFQLASSAGSRRRTGHNKGNK